MRKIILIAAIVAYIALKAICTGRIDPLTDCVMSCLIAGVYIMALACIDECKHKRASFTDALDGLYEGDKPGYINFKDYRA